MSGEDLIVLLVIGFGFSTISETISEPIRELSMLYLDE